MVRGMDGYLLREWCRLVRMVGTTAAELHGSWVHGLSRREVGWALGRWSREVGS